MAARRPAEAFHPGEVLREELEARGWTQTDLAEILGRPFPVVNEIIAGKRSISPETAAGLGAALGTSAEFWLNLEAAYQLWRVGDADHDPVTRRARLYSLAPIKDMVRRGWVKPSHDVAELEEQVKRFLELDTLDDEPRFVAAARKSTPYDSATPAQKAWLFRAKHLARAVQASAYAPAKLKDAFGHLKALMGDAEGARQVPRVLAEAGVRFVVVQPLANTRIDGACFWLDASSPVVAMSLRYDRIDNFWFVLWHELAHVWMRDGSLDTDLETAAEEADRPQFEAEADRMASEYLVAGEQLERFIARVRPLYSSTKIEGFARTIGVHPGIVVGQLQHRGEVMWSNFRKLLAPIREAVTRAALTDGWGTTAPALV